MYSIKNLLSKNPIQISGVVMAIMNLAIIMDWIEMSADGVAALNTALVALLGLFVTSATVNSAKLDELSDDGRVDLNGILLVVQLVFFVVAIFWFIDNAGWLD